MDSEYAKEPDGDTAVARDLQEAFEDAFLEAAVDLTWHGHHHSYQRTCPLYKGECREPNTGRLTSLAPCNVNGVLGGVCTARDAGTHR